MTAFGERKMAGKKMAIIASYFKGERYGLLGPQMAATIIEGSTDYGCIVVAVVRDDEKALLKRALGAYFGPQRPIIGFSTLSGRPDLFALAKELKDEGAITILAGPQADVDYLGEKDWPVHPHRFRGLSTHFSFALHGPAEQIIPFLLNPKQNAWRDSPGVLSKRNGNEIIHVPSRAWDSNYLKKVNWDNLYRIGNGGLTPLKINTGQVLQHIGCPHASRSRWVEIDYPVFLSGKRKDKVRLLTKGCSFCDVAADKGYHGALPMETVLYQIRSLPETQDGRKITFELINENAPPALPRLLHAVRKEGLRLSQVNLTLRADWLLKGERQLRSSLSLARDMGIKILLSAVGFEAFDDRILSNLNKGVTVETNLEAITLMRGLKEEFPDEWGYATGEGAIHGFIHPTPWDTPSTTANTQKNIHLHGLQKEILPPHSVPLIIHHASALGDWIREIEMTEHVQFKREVSVIGWWQIGDRFTL
jgi:hypothetical protein